MYQWLYQGNPMLGYALFALFLFIAIFSAVVCWTFLPRAVNMHAEAARLPLGDEVEP